MKIINHIKNEVYLSFILQKRYWLETLIGLLVLLSIFLGFFYGFAIDSFHNINEEVGGDSLDVLILGFAIWMFANGCYSSSSQDVVEEINNGSIEQLCLVPFSLPYILAVKTIVNIMSSFVLFFVLLNILFYTTGRDVEINYFILFLSLIFSAPSLIGIGFCMAGVILVHKRASILPSLIFVALIGIVSVDAYPINYYSLLPFSLGAAVAKEAVSNIVIESLFMPFFIIVLNSIFYLLLGLLVFSYCDCYARSRGILGHN